MMTPRRGVTAAADLANVDRQARQNRPGGPIMATSRGCQAKAGKRA